MRVIDSHVHFPEDRIIDDGSPLEASPAKADSSAPAPAKGTGYSSGRTGKHEHPWLESEKERWEKAWRFPTPVAVSKQEGERLWRKEVDDREWLKGVVLVTSGSNDFAAELVGRNQGAFQGYAHHDPLLSDAPERLERALAAGLRGYKMLGPKIDRSLDDPSFNPLWEVAAAREIPVLIHFGIMGGAGGIANHMNINPMVIHDVAKRFPRMPIIIPHFGCGYLFETLNLC
ncbi:MAG: amidohydrolase family protein, partial [Spirochaetota bacterium]